MTVKISITHNNTHIKDRNLWCNALFYNRDLTIPDFVNYLHNGHGYNSQYTGFDNYRLIKGFSKQSTFRCTNIITYDYDDPILSYDEMINIIPQLIYKPTITYETLSSNNGNKYRLLYVLDEIIDNEKDYRRIWEKIKEELSIIGNVDRCSCSPFQNYYGTNSSKKIHYDENNIYNKKEIFSHIDTEIEEIIKTNKPKKISKDIAKKITPSDREFRNSLKNELGEHLYEKFKAIDSWDDNLSFLKEIASIHPFKMATSKVYNHNGYGTNGEDGYCIILPCLRYNKDQEKFVKVKIPIGKRHNIAFVYAAKLNNIYSSQERNFLSYLGTMLYTLYWFEYNSLEIKDNITKWDLAKLAYYFYMNPELKSKPDTKYCLSMKYIITNELTPQQYTSLVRGRINYENNIDIIKSKNYKLIMDTIGCCKQTAFNYIHRYEKDIQLIKKAEENLPNDDIIILYDFILQKYEYKDISEVKSHVKSAINNYKTINTIDIYRLLIMLHINIPIFYNIYNNNNLILDLRL